jgi:hypothetical protein
MSSVIQLSTERERLFLMQKSPEMILVALSAKEKMFVLEDRNFESFVWFPGEKCPVFST